MKHFKCSAFLLSIVLISFMATSLLTSEAHAESKRFLAYGGVGTGRVGAQLNAGANTADFGGWGAHATAGIQIPFGNSFAFLSDANYSFADLQNSAGSKTIRENGTLNEVYAKAGLGYGRFELGGGYGLNTFKTSLLSSTGVIKDAQQTGTFLLAYTALSFDLEQSLRFQVYGEYSKGKFPDWTTSGYKMMLNFIVLFPLNQ